MIKQITVTNYLGESIVLDLRDPEKSGFLVRSISGLGPVKGSVNITEVSSSDGGMFNSARISKRNIVLDLVFLWKPTIEDVRLLSYRYFPVKKPITLTIETDKRKARIDGYVESNEPDIFSSQEAAQISIVCPDPYFHSMSGEEGNANLSFGSIVPYFEIEWDGSAPEPGYYFSIEYDDPEEFSALVTKQLNDIVYNGDDEVGITIDIRATGTVVDPAIYNADTDEVMRFKYTMNPGDTIQVVTVKGKKRATLIDANGATSNILNYLDKNATWFLLRKGSNRFSYTAAVGKEKLLFSINYDTIYGGI